MRYRRARRERCPGKGCRTRGANLLEHTSPRHIAHRVVSGRNVSFPHRTHLNICTRPGSVTCGMVSTNLTGAWHRSQIGVGGSSSSLAKFAAMCRADASWRACKHAAPVGLFPNVAIDLALAPAPHFPGAGVFATGCDRCARASTPTKLISPIEL
jgi:hypothetical protein